MAIVILGIMVIG